MIPFMNFHNWQINRDHKLISNYGGGVCLEEGKDSNRYRASFWDDENVLR